jgi:IPT/TIG domain
MWGRRSRAWLGMMAVLLGGLLWTLLAEPAAARAPRRVHAQQFPQSEPFVQLGRGFLAREPSFGSSVAVSSDGSVAVVSAQNSAYVFTRAGSAWQRQATLRDGGEVAISADGNTALIGGKASHVFTRTGSTWTQQATLGGGERSSALSADGNTVLMGTGAVFTRSGKTWTAQATLTGGETVALSADGSTALIGTGGPGSIRTLTIFTRSGATWAQQFEERSGEPNPPYATNFASSAALSADGNTAVLGIVTRLGDTILEGASDAVLLTRSGSTWTRQEQFPVGGGASVGLSSDGNSVLLGTPVLCGASRCEFEAPGTAWALTRSGSAWSQEEKLSACELTNRRAFEGLAYGHAVALSGDGRTALIGDPSHGNKGAAWVFRRGLPLPPPPVVTKLSPKAGPFYGEIVKIKGAHLCNADAVKFGGEEGFILSNSATSILVESPGGTPGEIVDVTVTTLGGTSAVSEADHFKYRKK